jgi:hypothetical protein
MGGPSHDFRCGSAYVEQDGSNASNEPIAYRQPSARNHQGRAVRYAVRAPGDGDRRFQQVTSMLGGAGLVAVLVTHAALEEIESPRPQKDGYLGRFEKHRNKLEQIASSKHQRGQVEVSGVVIVHAGDLGLISQRP